MTLPQPIFVTGHRGMVGSAVLRALHARRLPHPLTRTRQELDLMDAPAVDSFFAKHRPQTVIHCAARVGGIHANRTFPADFMRENLLTSLNVIDAAHRHHTPRLLYLGSSCIYPRDATQPLREDTLLSGPLEPTNEAYALAKIAGLKFCQYLRRQHDRLYHSAMPTNLYGPGDNYHPEHSHVIPGLLQRFHQAKLNNDPHVTLWGTGTPRREFLHVDDLADALLRLLHEPHPPDIINIGTGEDLPIRDLADLIAQTVGYTGRILTDPSMPDGTPRKLLDVSRIRSLGWQHAYSLPQGLRHTYQDFLRFQPPPQP